MKNLYLIGGGGHCKSCIDVVEASGEFVIKGIFDLKQRVGENILGYLIIGEDEDIAHYVKEGNYFLISLGQIKSPEPRKNILARLETQKAKLATIVSPKAYVSKHAQVAPGTIVMHGALVSAGAKIGKNCIINSKSLIEHDAVVEEGCHISTGATLNGEAIVKKHTFIGSGCILREGCVVEENSVISFGTRR